MRTWWTRVSDSNLLWQVNKHLTTWKEFGFTSK